MLNIQFPKCCSMLKFKGRADWLMAQWVKLKGNFFLDFFFGSTMIHQKPCLYHEKKENKNLQYSNIWPMLFSKLFHTCFIYIKSYTIAQLTQTHFPINQ